MHDRAQDIARRACDRPLAQREAFLEGACGDDRELRASVEKAIDALRSAGTAERPPMIETSESSAARFAEAKTIAPGEGGLIEGAGSTIGPYRILQLIGEGGFGFVYMAQQSAPVKRKVALKVIKPGMDSRQVVARFESERQALAMMDHPNIARVFDAGATPTGRPYFAMELVRGVPITEYCDSVQLSTPERIELLIDVCHAVQHAHHKGIVHRDLKPSNVLVTLHDDQPVVKVIDFGIAKAMNQDLTDGTLFTEFRSIVGTPEYMSPEQAAMSGLDIDARTDIYSLGVLLYELITGTTPVGKERLRGAGIAEIQKIITEGEPAKPSTRLAKTPSRYTKGAATTEDKPSTGTASAEEIARVRRTDPRSLQRLLSGDLDWICMKALEKDRRRRYETASALAEDLRRHLSFEPITARPPSTLYRLRKFARRNRAGVIAGLGALAAMLLTLAALTYGLIEVRHERDKTAERETTTRAEMLLSSMNAVRKYTAEHVRPALVTASQPESGGVPDYNAHFTKEMVPGYAAIKVFQLFRDAPAPQPSSAGDASPYGRFMYKEASPNPTNRNNLADAFEADLIRRFAADLNVTEITGIRDAQDGASAAAQRVFYIARPMVIRDAKCLDCHTTEEAAPPEQVAIYGKDGWHGGYGWKMNEVIAAQIVYVPVSEAFRADTSDTMAYLGGATGVIVLLLVGMIAVLTRRA